MIPGSASPFFLGASKATGGGAAAYQIERSLRFNSSDSAYLSRTPAVAGNRRTWTWAGWVKRSGLSSGYQTLFSSGSGTGRLLFQFGPGDTFLLDVEGSGSRATPAVFRDPSAWYHVIVAFDTTQATAADRTKVWINNNLQTLSGITFSQNTDYAINNSVEHRIGCQTSSLSDFFNGYLADIHFIDGQALTPSSFTEVSATTGQLVPIAYTGGSYGTNGFYLQFADNSSNTATTLGKDTSGNGNNWTPNNFSVSDTLQLPILSSSNTGQLPNLFTSTLADSWGFNYTGNNYLLFDFGSSQQVTEVTVRSRSGYSDGGGTWQLQYSTNNSSWTATQTYNGYGDNELRTWSTGSNTARYWRLIQTVDNSAYSYNLVGVSFTAGGVTYVTTGYADRSGLSFSTSYTLVQNPGNDSLVDTPTSNGTDTGVGNEVRGNYCTGNPLFSVFPSFRTLSNGNIDWKFTDAGSTTSVPGTIFASSGKWYAEFTITSLVNAVRVGIIKNDSTDDYIGKTTGSYGYQSNDGNKRTNTASTAYGATFTTGDVIGVALDLDIGTLTFYKNGVSQGQAYSSITGSWTFAADSNNNTLVSFNAGQRAFAYPVSGFKALCDTNLGAPVVAKPNTLMDVALYTGNGSTQTISGLNFSPDFVWIKTRSTVEHHVLVDAVRGTSKNLFSSTTTAEETSNPYGSVTAFNSDGFAVGGGSIDQSRVNGNSVTHVAWTWDAGTSTVSNTDGSITSQVRANASAGFSVVIYTGNGSSGATVGHGLGAKPFLRIIKRRDATSTIGWMTFHESAPTSYFTLNSTNAATPSSEAAPTSTVFSLPADANSNASGGTYVAYCFAPVVGYSSMGSYVGNGSSDGSFVYTGFRPKFILGKVSSTTDGWFMFDATRSPYNVANSYLAANASAAEATFTFADFLSNGFKLRATTSDWNASGQTYIYYAVAESPFQYARAR